MIESLVLIFAGLLGCLVVFGLLIGVNFHAPIHPTKIYRDGNKKIYVKGGVNPDQGPHGGVFASRFRDEYGKTDRWKDRYLGYSKRRRKEKGERGWGRSKRRRFW